MSNITGSKNSSKISIVLLFNKINKFFLWCFFFIFNILFLKEAAFAMFQNKDKEAGGTGKWVPKQKKKKLWY